MAENVFLPNQGFIESNATTFDKQFPYCLIPNRVTGFSLGKHPVDIGTSLEGLEARQLRSTVPRGMIITMLFDHLEGCSFQELLTFLSDVGSDYLPFHLPWDHSIWDLIPCSKEVLRNWITYPGWRVVYSGEEGFDITPNGCSRVTFSLTIKNVLGEGAYLSQSD